MSLPSRERGLKFCPQKLTRHPDLVAPLAGAWIEIKKKNGELMLNKSLPSRERGLKLLYEAIDALIQQVAPLAGAWIEMTGR